MQTACAGFKEYWPGLLENVVWIQCGCVLKLFNGTRGRGQVEHLETLGSLQGVHITSPQGKEHGWISHLSYEMGGAEESVHTPVL